MCAAHGGTLIGGGTLVMSGLWPSRPAALVDISRLGLDAIDFGDDEVQIGAFASFSQLAAALAIRGPAWGALHQAAGAFTSHVVALAATVGGNVATGRGSLVAPLRLFDAVAYVRTADGLLEVPIAELRPGAGLLERFVISAAKMPTISGFRGLSRTPSGPGLVSVAVGDGPVGVTVEVMACGSAHRVCLPADTAAENAPEALLAALPPLPDDTLASAAYRRAMAGVLTRRVLTDLREAS